jgi:hypothetical protein
MLKRLTMAPAGWPSSAFLHMDLIASGSEDDAGREFFALDKHSMSMASELSISFLACVGMTDMTVQICFRRFSRTSSAVVRRHRSQRAP